MQKMHFTAVLPRLSLLQTLRTPVLAPILAQRVLARTIIGAVALHLIGSAFGVSLWLCPVREVTGIPCPGCGLSRAAILLLRGQWRQSWQMHAYAPLLFLALFLLFLAAFLPQKSARDLVNIVTRIENRTALAAIALAFLPLYWVFRLISHTAPL